jgi:hypothetical protein
MITSQYGGSSSIRNALRPVCSAAIKVLPGSSNRSSDAGSADAAEENSSGDREYVSFEDDFESELTSELGDLGPSSPAPSGGGDRGRSRGGRGRSGGRR